MNAALHAVPDPEDGTSPGEWPVPVPVPRPALPGEPPAVEDDPPEVDEDDEEEGQGDEAPASSRALTMPDLRPYLDPRPLVELGPFAVEVGRASRPPLARALRATGAFLFREAYRVGAAMLSALWGLWLLGQSLARWLSGEVGKGGTVGTRIGGAVLVAYGIVHASVTNAAVPWAALAAVVVLAVLVGVGRITLPEPKPAGKRTDGKKADGKKPPAKKTDGKPSGKKAPEESADDPAEPTPESAVEEAVPASRLSGLRGLLVSRRKPPAEGAGDTPDQDEEEPPAQPGQQALVDAPVEAPRRPSREDLIRALNRPDRERKGVLLTTLQQRLNLPHTRAVKEVLDGAGIRWRDGVRTTTGNGPGVHPIDIPPLTPDQEAPQGADVAAVQSANANNNNGANTAGEELDAEGTVPWIGPVTGDRYTPAPGTNRGAWTITPSEKP